MCIHLHGVAELMRRDSNRLSARPAEMPAIELVFDKVSDQFFVDHVSLTESHGNTVTGVRGLPR